MSGGVRWLGDHQCHHDAVVGGKAASLSRLAALHKVPHGFAVPAIPAAHAPELGEMADAIVQAYALLGERCGASHPAVAVRSSALDEDGLDASFAGQHDTYLNIRGTDAVLDAVQRCVRSAVSPGALAYRAERGLRTDDVRIAVLIQQLVVSEVSAVVFSANPVTGSRDEVMINANWGLGESIVGGSVTPDMFVVEKAGFGVTGREIACKERMTVRTEDGTTEVDTPDDLRSAPTLDDEGIRAMAALAVKLEDAVGHAVDIECAMAESTLYLLQCRPITTLG